MGVPGGAAPAIGVDVYHHMGLGQNDTEDLFQSRYLHHKIWLSCQLLWGVGNLGAETLKPWGKLQLAGCVKQRSFILLSFSEP